MIPQRSANVSIQASGVASAPRFRNEATGGLTPPRSPICLLMVSSLVLVSSLLVAQDAKVPTKTAEPKSDPAALSPIDEAVAAELADRVRRDEAVTWLSKPTQVSFAETTLADVATFLADTHEVRIRLDAVPIADMAFAQTTVTLVTEKQSLAHVLNRITQSAGAAWTIHRGDILITSPEREQQLHETRVYRVGRLLRLSAARAVLPGPPAPRPLNGAGFFSSGPIQASHELANDDLLVRFLTESTSVPWQATSGEGGTMSLMKDQLIVRQTYHGHEEVARLLRFAEQALSRAPGSPPLLVMPADEATQFARLQKALRREIDLRLVQTPLPEIVALLHDRLGEEVYVEQSEATKQLNISSMELSLTEGRFVAREALRQMLSPHNLTAIIDDGAIRITTVDQAHLRQVSVIYDIADLLHSTDDLSALQSAIQEGTSGPWQQLTGEGGTISDLLGGLLVIRQNKSVHTEVALLLHELRQARKEAVKDPPTPKTADLETRFHKAKSKDEAESLERLILTFVSPATWDVSGGRGVLRTAEDRLIIQQTKAVHDQIDLFLREYQQAKPIGAAAKQQRLPTVPVC